MAPARARKKKGLSGAEEVGHAPQPGQTLNIDVCFVPTHHRLEAKLPAVSGSSGHLVIERLPEAGKEPHWPGQVFAQAELDYTAAMQAYVAATQDRLKRTPASKRVAVPDPPAAWRQDWEGRTQRHALVQQRKLENALWQAIRAHHHSLVVAYRHLSQVRRKQQRAAWEMELAFWQQQKQEHQALLKTRRQENQVWHQRHGTDFSPTARSWIAILVVSDNCTRQCLALPAFATGAKLSSAELVAALKEVLPAGLQFVISDQGLQFRSNLFAQLAREADFVHVVIYRHRPQSNGIAERFVQTLKAGLRDQVWSALEELEPLLCQFQLEYNDRPHQGLATPGLSPNEFANRIWLM